MKIQNTKPSQNTRILSVGAYRPSRVVPNSQIVDAIESSDEWIQQRTGIKTRHFADADESLIDMAYEAAKIAIERAGVHASDIDTVIFSTITYPFQAPSAATELITRLGNTKAAAFDIGAACAGFSYGVGIASDLVRNHTSKYVLVIGAEKLSDFTSPTDRATAFIFADGAGAVVIGPSDADNRDAIMMTPSWLDYKKGGTVDKIGWPDISQEGQRVFRWAVYEIAQVGKKAISAAGIQPSDLAAFIPHQANERIIDSLVKSMELPDGIVIARDIQTTGNTSAASIPLAMDRVLAENPQLSGKLALLIGFGAGLVFSSQVVVLP